MCRLLTSTIKNCEPNVGGIKRLYLNRADNKDNINILAGTFTVNDMNLLEDELMVEMPFARNSASYDVSYTVDANGVQEYTHSLSFKVNKRFELNHQAVASILDGNKDLFAVIQDNNDNWILLGYDYGLNATRANGGVASAKGTGSSYDISLTGIQSNPEYFIDPAVLPSILLDVPM